PVTELIERCIHGKNVVVTGAGGSIGSELCRQILEHTPSVLILFEQSEYALYAIEKELESYNLDIKIVAVLGSVTDSARVESVFKSFSVNTVPCCSIQACAIGGAEPSRRVKEQCIWNLANC
ncbi:MAG: hypothetical protein DRR42_26040, partial [Gammaproteobacteria bacterium]